MSQAIQPMYWSIRRELFENRSLYIAPLIAAGLNLFIFVGSLYHLAERRRAVLLLDEVQQRARIGQSYDFAAVMLLFTAIIVGIFYCVDALYGERRDRSILFWKSLPVSDLTAVLAKASIPLCVLPLIVFVITLTTQLVMLLLSSAVLLLHGLGPTTSSQLPLFQNSLVLLYGLIVLALWHAPIYGWLLLISAWARRAPALWVVLPPMAIAAMEKLVFNSMYFVQLLGNRFLGHVPIAFDFKGGRVDTLSQLTPGRFVSTPGLWIGLVLAVLFIAAAARLRRNREAI
jgi:ABC-2 type transport system permease protein